ncbi:MAG: tetratricopeptide repeat protein [Bacteroidales bacterium]|nr:tetratricopeptide repeat protein [Bacteroidales bacterium]
MAKSKKSTQETSKGLENIESSLSKAESYIERNQNKLLYIVGGIVLIVAIYLGYQKYVVEPHIEESKEVHFVAQQYFASDSFALALNGDGTNLGWLAINEEYGSTPIGELSNYYVGICYLQLGNYEEAISYLEKFDTEDPILGPLAKGNIGNAHAELGDLDQALSFYLEAVNMNDNKYTTPMFMLKAALIYELQGNNAEALKLYETVSGKYSLTPFRQTSDKYMAKLKAEV